MSLIRYLLRFIGFTAPSFSREEIKIVKATQLFDEFSGPVFQRILQNAERITFNTGDIIIREGDIGHEFYIILNGSVRVFTRQMDEKIALARLEKGNYFGEQAILSLSTKRRNASVEAITDVELVKISEKWVVPHWYQQTRALAKLNKIGAEQAFKILAETIGHFKNALADLQNIKGAIIKEFKSGDVIFATGDKPDNIYLILQGEIKLVMPESNKVNIIIQRGQIFGEAGIVTNSARIATAIAQTDVKLLCIGRKSFKKAYRKLPEIQQLLRRKQRIHQLPSGGIIQQYLGKVGGISMYTSIYKMEDGRNIIANQSIEGELFSMRVYDKEITQRYSYKNIHLNVELGVADNHLCEIQVYGAWNYLTLACGIVINNENIATSALQSFEYSGALAIKANKNAAENSAIVCDCMMVSKEMIVHAIDEGAHTLKQISAMTGACTVCKRCEYRVLDILGQAKWIVATIKLLHKYSENVQDFVISTHNTSITKYIPGQHIILQARINDLLIERPYTISQILADGNLRITVKKETHGLLSTYLFAHAQQGVMINISEAQGDFILPMNNAPIICFAGGIGITPFMAFAHAIAKDRKLHIIYCAATANDFIFAEELQQIMLHNSCVSVTYRPQDSAAALSAMNIRQDIMHFANAEIYICGPDGFERVIVDTLHAINFPAHKVHIEKFVFASENMTK